MKKYALKKGSRLKTAKNLLLFWCLFIGLGAVAGSVGMFSDTTGKAMGMDAMLPYFQVLPFADILFQDFLFSGFALLIVNGLTNLTAAALILTKRKVGLNLGFIFGITLMLWISIQFYIFEPNFMDISYFIFGALQTAAGYASLIFYRQEKFQAEESDFDGISDYRSINNDTDVSDAKELVVYFSRMGYTEKIARQTADNLKADIYQIKSSERTSGTLGFWWCGRFGMHRWEMPIEPLDMDLSAYDHVTICTPIWVFNICAPVRSFCKATSGRIKSVDYMLIHYQNMKYGKAVCEMDSLLQVKGNLAASICCRQGIIKNVM